MPYGDVSELPPNIQRALPPHAQRIFMETFNASYHHGEVSAFRIAWAAVKRAGYHKDASGRWVR